MGAILASLVGAGKSLEEIETFLLTNDFNKLIYPERSGSSLLGNERIVALLAEHLGDADLRDLSPRIAVMGTDLATKQRVILQEGHAVTAVLASMSLPGFFPPVRWGDSLLVDGGVLDNVPTQAAYQLGAERLIAVDVSGGPPLDEATLGNLEVFNGRLYRALYWLLSLSKRGYAFEIWMRSADVTMKQLTDQLLETFPPHVLIRPEMPEISLFSTDRIQEAIAAGERAAQLAAPQIETLLKVWHVARRPPPHANTILSLPADGSSSAA